MPCPGAFFAASEGHATGVKSFYDIGTKLCISAAHGTCGDYGADVPECIGSGLQPSYAAYLQSRFDDIASRYLSGMPPVMLHLYAFMLYLHACKPYALSVP